jgi:hypothetical protein
MTTIDNTLARIAKEHMQIETLHTRKHDALDFHTVAVWEAKSALQAAYDAGRADATPGSTALVDARRENLSPEAVAAIASWLQPARTNDENVDREVRWFTEQLAQALGGWDQQSRLAEELGL